MNDKDMSSGLTIEGLNVETNIFPGESPYASSAEFYLRNNAEAKEVTIASVDFRENENTYSVETYEVYSQDSALHKKFRMPAHGDLQLRITFPFILVGAGRNSTYEVKAKFQSDGHEYEAISKLIFTFEME